MKSWLRYGTIAQKLVAIIMLASAASLFVLWAALVVNEVLTLRSGIERELLTISDIVGENSQAALSFHDAEAAHGTLAALHAEPHITRACLYTRDGQPIAGYWRAQRGLLSAMPPASSERTMDGRHTLGLMRSIQFRGEIIGSVFVETDLDELRARLRRDAILFCSALAASLLIAFGLGTLLQRRISSPILALATTADTVSRERNYSIRAQRHDPDEIGLLVDRFNEMLGEIEARDHQLQEHHRRLEEQVARRTEQALQSESKFRSLVRNAPYGMFVANWEGELLDANPAFVRMLGYESEEQVQLLRLSDMFDAEHEWLQCRANLVWQAGKEWEGVETTWNCCDGRKIRVQLTGRAIYENGGTWLDCIVQDITQKAMLEAQLRQSQRMEAIGTLTGGIAHDFNNILMIILSYCEELLSRVPPDDPLFAHIEQIHKAGERAAGLVRQLLAFSRKQIMRPRVLNPNSALTDMRKILQRLVGEDIDVVCEPASVAWPILADPVQFEQVVLNLASNARDAMPRGGHLLLKIVNRQIDHESARSLGGFSRGGDFVEIIVSDSGTGIPPELHSQIFEPFFTTKESGKGTGLGLSTVYGIVKQSGGHISVESQPDQGTTFHIYLPRVAEAVPTPVAARPSAEKPHHRGEILLVEDEAAVREAMCAFLENEGYQVVSAPNAREALNICTHRAQPFSAMLSDVVMPGGMNGVELAQTVAQRSPSTAILLMSGYTDDLLSRFGVFEQNVRFLQKPFSRSDLISTLNSALKDRLTHGVHSLLD